MEQLALTLVKAGVDTNDFFNVGEFVSFSFDRDVEFLRMLTLNNLGRLANQFKSLAIGANGGSFTVNDGNTDAVDNQFNFRNWCTIL